MARMDQISSNDYSEIYNIDGVTVRAARAYWHDSTEATVTLYDEDGETMIEGTFEMAPDGYDPDTHEGPEAHTDWEAYEAFILELYDESQEKGIRERIREARIEAEMTQQQLADALGTQQRQITRWESYRVPEVTTLIRIARATGTTVAFLVGEDDE